MGRIKSAIEIAMEKTAKVKELTPEEKEKMKDQEEVKSLLSEFYRGEIDSNALWQRLKGSKQSMLKEAQLALIETLRPRISTIELRKRKEGILAIESLKEAQNISTFEAMLNFIEFLQKDYEEKEEKIANYLREEIERNPQLRMQPVKTSDGKTVMQMTLSADEAVEKRLADSLSDYEEQYNREFTEQIEKLKKEIK